MGESFLAYLKATQSLLQRLEGGDAADVSKTQSVVLESMLRGLDLDIVALAQISEVLDTAKFAPADAERLQRAISEG